MISAFVNHLWQSTVFALAVMVLSLGFRKNRAQVRYWLWLSASLKFLIPFSFLFSVGNDLWGVLAPGKILLPVAAPAVSTTILQISQPFSDTLLHSTYAPHTVLWSTVAILAVWVCGSLCVAVLRFRNWLRIREAVRRSTPLEIAATLPVLSSSELFEPGVVGLFRPVLVLPAGILNVLTRPQLEAVIAHEQCHVQRRDNLTSAMHMIVEIVFWFHPLVWWIGAQLLTERERACDEEVLRLGTDPSVYAEGILNVCKNYLDSPLRCVSGISGSELKKRLNRILNTPALASLNSARKLALTFAALATITAPILVGLIGAPTILARTHRQEATTWAPNYKYQVISIRPSTAGDPAVRRGFGSTPGHFTATNLTVRDLVLIAYGIFDNQLSGDPDWVRVERYDIEATTDDPAVASLQKASYQESTRVQQQMLQNLLADRFKLTIRRETRNLPVYELSVAKNGPKFQEGKVGDTYNNGLQKLRGGPSGPGTSRLGERGRDTTYTGQAVAISDLVETLAGALDTPVLDKTGLTAKYDFSLEWGPDVKQTAQPQVSTPSSKPVSPLTPEIASLLAAVQDQLGLNLASTTGPVEVIVVQRIEKPSVNK